MDDSTLPKLQRVHRLSASFTPSAPVSNMDAFAGRFEEIVQVSSALATSGRQVVLYGERGVGKTSLANVITDVIGTFNSDHTLRNPIRINCHTADTFSSIWERILKEAGIPLPENWAYSKHNPDEIRMLLSSNSPILAIIDEFDRLEDDESITLMADLIKALSDHDTDSKVMLVGVALSIDQLIGDHASVQRAIEEVLMPRMSPSDMTQILTQGGSAADLTYDEGSVELITKLSEGLPHYVHLLALRAGKRAIEDDRGHVTLEDVEESTKIAVSKHSLMKEYQSAIQSPRKDNLFAQVLAACALAKKNSLGQFTSGSVREPLSAIMGKPYDIPAFAPHLKSFTGLDRGAVLVQEGVPRRYTYRFENPLLQPFSIMAAMSSGIIKKELLASLFLASSEDS